ncbi:hypothetical protein J7K41_04235 [Candidatus Micrarchaeota archaeon]|nr:hypothetical protein [Candidatus Micrarchaeota archaeon]
MLSSNLEELAKLYFMANGYLVTDNVFFFIPREKTGKRVSGWTDIDVLGYKKGTVAVVQCKEYLGTKSIDSVVKDLDRWFSSAEAFLRSDASPLHGLLTQETRLLRYLVIGHEPSTNQTKKLSEAGINVIGIKELLTFLIADVNALTKKAGARGTGADGKESHLVRYLLKKMLKYGLVSDASVSEGLKEHVAQDRTIQSGDLPDACDQKEYTDKVRIAVEHLTRKRERSRRSDKHASERKDNQRKIT